MFSVPLNFPRSYFIIFFKGQLLGFTWWFLEALLEILCCCVVTLVFVGVTKIQLVKLSHAYGTKQRIL